MNPMEIEDQEFCNAGRAAAGVIGRCVKERRERRAAAWAVKSKIERIAHLFVGLEVEEMTTLELQVHAVLKEEDSTPEQREQAKLNSDAVLGDG